MSAARPVSVAAPTPQSDKWRAHFPSRRSADAASKRTSICRPQACSSPCGQTPHANIRRLMACGPRTAGAQVLSCSPRDVGRIRKFGPIDADASELSTYIKCTFGRRESTNSPQVGQASRATPLLELLESVPNLNASRPSSPSPTLLYTKARLARPNRRTTAAGFFDLLRMHYG